MSESNILYSNDVIVHLQGIFKCMVIMLETQSSISTGSFDLCVEILSKFDFPYH